jgi:hypothetical protein
MGFTREQALSILGLPSSASRGDVERAYDEHKRPLKRRLVKAPSIQLKNRYRRKLRELVRARDVALGEDSRPADRVRRLALDEDPLLESLEFEQLGPGQAFAILQLPADAAEGEIQRAYTLRYRFLTQQLARARDDRELARLRWARGQLLAVRRCLLERPPEPPAPSGGQTPLELSGIFFDDAPESLEDTLASPARVLEETGIRLAGSAAEVTAAYRRLLAPLRENLTKAKLPELKEGYLQAIKDLRRKRDRALRPDGDSAELD